MQSGCLLLFAAFAWLGPWGLVHGVPMHSDAVVHFYSTNITQLPLFMSRDTAPFSITIAKGRWDYQYWGRPWDPAPDGVHVETANVSLQLLQIMAYATGTSLSLVNKENSFTLENGVYHAFLPREAFCTENLSPLGKILPYRTLPMDTLAFFNSQYHSLRLSHDGDSRGQLALSFTMVTLPGDDEGNRLSRGWESGQEYKARNGGFTYVRTVASEMERAPLRVERTILGWGQMEGRLMIELKNVDSKRPIRVSSYKDVTPWFMLGLGHTIKVAPNAQRGSVRFAPAKRHGHPNVISMTDVVIAPLETITIKMYFEKTFLNVADFPPDADHGLEVFSGWARDSDGNVVYGNGLLVDMPKPDFSMPFNVITLTSTVLAFLFGSVFNALVRRKRKHHAKPKAKAKEDSNGEEEEKKSGE